MHPTQSRRRWFTNLAVEFLLPWFILTSVFMVVLTGLAFTWEWLFSATFAAWPEGSGWHPSTLPTALKETGRLFAGAFTGQRPASLLWLVLVAVCSTVISFGWYRRSINRPLRWSMFVRPWPRRLPPWELIATAIVFWLQTCLLQVWLAQQLRVSSHWVAARFGQTATLVYLGVGLILLIFLANAAVPIVTFYICDIDSGKGTRTRLQQQVDQTDAWNVAAFTRWLVLIMVAALYAGLLTDLLVSGGLNPIAGWQSLITGWSTLSQDDRLRLFYSWLVLCFIAISAQLFALAWLQRKLKRTGGI